MVHGYGNENNGNFSTLQVHLTDEVGYFWTRNELRCSSTSELRTVATISLIDDIHSAIGKKLGPSSSPPSKHPFQNHVANNDNALEELETVTTVEPGHGSKHNIGKTYVEYMLNLIMIFKIQLLIVVNWLQATIQQHNFLRNKWWRDMVNLAVMVNIGYHPLFGTNGMEYCFQSRDIKLVVPSRLISHLMTLIGLWIKIISSHLKLSLMDPWLL